jgi:hypothetical protein
LLFSLSMRGGQNKKGHGAIDTKNDMIDARKQMDN